MNSEGSGLGLQIHGGLTSQWFDSTFRASFFCTDTKMRGPGIEPGSTAWKAAMLTIAPATLLKKIRAAGVEPAT
jgi:hypothetical protein